MMKIRKVIGILSIILLSGILILTVTSELPPLGSFPTREVGENFKDEAVGQKILERAPEEVGGANAVTDTLWDYRGYDSLGEATVIFVAVAGVIALFRASKKDEKRRNGKE